MHRNDHRKLLLNVCMAAGSLLLGSVFLHGQDSRWSASSDPPPTETPSEVRILSDMIRELQAQVQGLNAQLSELRMEQQHTSQEAREIRHELDLTKAQIVPVMNGFQTNSYAVPVSRDSASSSLLASPASVAAPQDQTPSDRIAKLEENQEVTEGKVNDLYQTKVESGSKYRLRLSGIMLLNLYENRGAVENQDFPQYVQPPQSVPLYVSPGAFGGSLRQSQLRLQAYGPDIAGAHTSADVQFDFAGGFPNTWNGVAMGIVRLRTGTVRLDWANTSIIAGQDHLFFAPLAPTSLATLAIPALSYAGNLWSWAPQVRVEHRIALSDTSTLLLQGGILDSLSGDLPEPGNYRYPSWGEESGQPAYAARISWSHRVFGQNLTVGFGGYYGRQDWGFNRNVDGWAATTDVTLPLGKLFEFTGEFYRGRAVAGLGGGIGQSVLLTGSFIDPSTTFRGLDSMGGWAQLKFKPIAKLEINGALGLDNPFAAEMRLYQPNSIYPNLFSRNLSPFVNFIYQVRSDVLFSIEYRHLQTSVLDNGSNSANHANLSLGYIF
jgi:hypothetical protein